VTRLERGLDQTRLGKERASQSGEGKGGLASQFRRQGRSGKAAMIAAAAGMARAYSGGSGNSAPWSCRLWPCQCQSLGIELVEIWSLYQRTSSSLEFAPTRIIESNNSIDGHP
jgi:hypothetical protein